jgi:hypothetical protein
MNRFALICLLFAATAQAQMMTGGNATAELREAQGPATQSLDALRQLVTPTNFQDMGFASADEVKEATLGQPIPVYMVRLDELREFKSGSDPAVLLRSLGKAIYPVAVRQQVRSSVTLERKGDQWRATEFGSPRLAVLLEKVRMENSMRSGIAPADYFAVHVPALSTYFLGHRVGSKVMLTPLVDNPEARLAAGRTITAEEAFTGLLPIARQYNGLPI